MSVRLTVFASALAAALFAAGVAGFAAKASDHPNVEPSTAAACGGCHMTDFRSASHHVGEKPTTCGSCHAQTSWRATHFDHPFALSGAHAKTSCFVCHRGDPPAFHGTPNACIGCHQAEYERATPPHVGHFPTTCQECHSFEGWKPTLEEDEPPPPPPPPPPTATASTPPPPPPLKPKPKPSATGTTKPPPIDVVTHPSRHERAE